MKAIKTNKQLSTSVLEHYKDVIDSFGGVVAMSEHFGWHETTPYSWLRGKLMGLSFAICISIDRPIFSLSSLVGYDLEGDKIYQEILHHFGSQSNASEALGIPQCTFHAWIKGNSKITLEKAELLNDITNGKFKPLDFKHFQEQQERILTKPQKKSKKNG